jgi:imidazolonepropionase-like amidohydrolase
MTNLKLRMVSETLTSAGESFRVKYPQVSGLDDDRIERALNFGLENKAKTKARVERSTQAKTAADNRKKFDEFLKLAEANKAPDAYQAAVDTMRVACNGVLPPMEVQDEFTYRLEDLF